MTQPPRRPNPGAAAIIATQYPPGSVPQDITLFNPPGGIRGDKTLGQLDATESPELLNHRILYGGYKVRPPLAHLGNVVSDPILSVAYTLDGNGNEVIQGCGAAGLYQLVGSMWVALAGPTLHADAFARYSTAGWNLRLIYANDYDPVGEIDYQAGTYRALTGAPIGRFVSTFGGRVVVGNIGGSPNRVQWCADRNENDWTGFGSGFEDLLAAPGGTVDAVHGVFPQSDVNCLLVRSRSIWDMQTTGQFDAPFAFQQLWTNLESAAPWSLVQTPAGVMGLFRNGVTLLGLDRAPTPVGYPVRDAMFAQAMYRRASAAYDYYQNAYCIAIPGVASSLIWRYHFESQVWTCDSYPFVVSHIASAIYTDTLQVGQLTGQVSQLVGPVELLGLGGTNRGLLLPTGVGGQFVARDDMWTTSVAADQLPDGSTAPIATVIVSDILRGDSLLATGDLVQVVVEYIASRAQTLSLDFSTDGGTTWSPLGSASVVATAVPDVVRFDVNHIARKRIQVRLTSADGAGFELLALHPRFVPGGKIDY